MYRHSQWSDHVNSQTQTGARVEFNVNKRLSAVATGQNLFDPSHAEYTPDHFPVVYTSVARGAT